MDIIKTGIGLSKTIRNASRYREILTVFAKHGLQGFILKTGLHTKIPDFVLPQSFDPELSETPEGDDWWTGLGHRLRRSFEELGPSFIKLGQLMSTREDIFHPNVIQELKYLQNKVQFEGIKNVKQVIGLSLNGKKIEEVFLSIDEKPMATASIAAVYGAKLVSGEEVVIKVRKPNINKIINTDFQILSQIVGQLEKVSIGIKAVGASKVVEDFFKSIQLELNFVVEGRNAQRLEKNLAKVDKDKLFVIPKIYEEFSNESILVMQRLDGIPFNEIKNVKELPADFPQKLEKSVVLFIHSLLADGFFHADLHGGNFFYLNNGQIGLIDFGLMGTLSKQNRENLVAILYSLFNGNYENLVYEFLDVAEYEIIPNPEQLVRDVRDALSPYIGLSVQQTNMSELVRGIIRTLADHKLFLPREWFIIFRALMTVDGTGKSLGMDLNVYNLLENDLNKIMSDLVSKQNLSDDLLWGARDVAHSLRLLPRHMRWFMKEMAKKNYAFDLNLKGHEKDVRLITNSIYFLGLSMVTSVFVLSGVYFAAKESVLTLSDVPGISWVFWILGFGIFLKGHFEVKSK